MRRQSQGFTLLEIAVALAVLGIGVVTVMQIFQGALRLQNKSAQQNRVVLVARQVLDEILSEPMDRLRPALSADEVDHGQITPGVRCERHLEMGDLDRSLGKPVAHLLLAARAGAQMHFETMASFG